MEKEKNETKIDKDFFIRNYSLDIQPTVEELSLLDEISSTPKVSQLELEKFKNAPITSRIVNHILAGASLGFYNPYKISADEAEKENWFYKRFIRIPFLEDLISPYGFSLAGLVESLPLFAVGGIFRPLAKMVGVGKLGEVVDKSLSLGIRTAEKIGVSAVEKTSGLIASKIPQVEKAWMSLSPQIRHLGYELIKKDLQFAPWVAGATYRAKSLEGEDASRINEYISALYNPVNLLFVGGLTGIEARIAASPLMKQGRTFWEALGDLQRLNDLRSPLITQNIRMLIRDGLVERNPMAFNMLRSYANSLDDIIDPVSLSKALSSGIEKLSPEAEEIISRSGLLGYIEKGIKNTPTDTLVLQKLLDDPAFFLREGVFKNEKVNSLIAKYSSLLKELGDESSLFFDNFVSKNETILGLLKNNSEIVNILSKPNISYLEKNYVVDFLLKQKDLIEYLKADKDVSSFIQKTSGIVGESSSVIKNIIDEINKTSLDELWNVRNSIIKSNSYPQAEIPLLSERASEIFGEKSIVPVGEVGTITSSNVLIPKEFIKDIMRLSEAYIGKEGIVNLMKSGELKDFLARNTTPANFSYLVSKYPEILGITQEDAIKIKNVVELAKIEEKIPNEKVAEELKSSIKDKQYFIANSGIKKPESTELLQDVNILLNNSFDLFKKSEIYNKLTDAEKKFVENYLGKKIIEMVDFGGDKFGFGPFQKFFLSVDLWREKLSTNPKLFMSKIAIDAIEYLSDLSDDLLLEIKSDIINYYIGKKTFKQVETSFRKVWEELKQFRIVNGAFSEKSFWDFVGKIVDIEEFTKTKNKMLGKQAAEDIMGAKQFFDEDIKNFIDTIYSTFSADEISKIIESDVNLRKNIIVDDAKKYFNEDNLKKEIDEELKKLNQVSEEDFTNIE